MEDIFQTIFLAIKNKDKIFKSDKINEIISKSILNSDEVVYIDLNNETKISANNDEKFQLFVNNDIKDKIKKYIIKIFFRKLDEKYPNRFVYEENYDNIKDKNINEDYMVSVQFDKI